MILDIRQSHFPCVSFPEIKHQAMPNIRGYASIVKAFEKELMKKRCYYYNKGFYKDIIREHREMYNDCLKQTVHFLKSIKALKPAKEIKQIQLWEKWVKMKPLYEGIFVQLKSMLIKFHCPTMYEEMSRGKSYSHETLTDIKEAVLYLMEYFSKEKLLKEPGEVSLDGLG